MAELKATAAFFLGILVAVVAFLVFYYFSRQNVDIANYYRESICSSVL